MTSPFANPVGVIHDRLIFSRRIRVLSEWFDLLTPNRARLLDVGCGSGQIAALLNSRRPDLTIQGVDVLVRDRTHIPVEQFDGAHLPFPNRSFDVVLFSDVLHHAPDPLSLQREARRVAGQFLIIKDHFQKGFAARVRLRLMDWIGNARFGVSLPYNYWTEPQWRAAWRELDLTPAQLVTHLGLYPVPADLLFGANLHFIAKLSV